MNLFIYRISLLCYVIIVIMKEYYEIIKLN